MRRIFHFLWLVTFVMLCNQSSSQIVNIESSRMQSDTTGWLGNASAHFELTGNVQKITQVNVTAHIQYKTVKNVWLLIGNYGLLKADNESLIKNRFAHLRFNHKLNNWLRWEIFGQAQDNYISNIAARFLLGTGPRVKIAGTKPFRLYIGSLMMYEYEKDLAIPPEYHHDIRNSSYLSFTIHFNPIVEFISSTFYQPLLKRFADSRILNETSMHVKTGKHFGFGTDFSYLHDRYPAAKAPETTYDLAVGIQYDF